MPSQFYITENINVISIIITQRNESLTIISRHNCILIYRNELNNFRTRELMRFFGKYILYGLQMYWNNDRRSKPIREGRKVYIHT